jgi:pyruvate-ferredoxin/flavodoxin oxidoreductase
MASQKIMVDGNEAAATVAYACSEIAAIYPITPSSNMGEWADEWSARNQPNLWGTVPQVVEMQSEGGASGAVHGALTTGSLVTTFTASQGLLLMIPNMYKIAGELTPTVFHVSARSLACQALSIFGDHSDVMACRQTGFALLAANSVQEVMDLATIAHAATLEARVPFLHFFDGFRTSHEVQKIAEVSRETIRAMIAEELVAAHRRRGLSPDRPAIRGTAQNPDVYFQGRETVNKYYAAAPAIVQKHMDRFAKLTGRQYRLFDYVGAPDAEHVVVVMGSGADAIHEYVGQMTAAGAKIGVIKVRLYRPFDTLAFAKVLPRTLKTLTVLDRTKEPGAIGEPLYIDVRSAMGEVMQDKLTDLDHWIATYGGRYGLGSKEFTPAMIKAVFDNAMSARPRNHFTVGIEDDVTGSSLPVKEFHLDHPGRKECMFYGLGSDGTVGANKNSIKIIGDDTDFAAQGYFVYDSKKAGAVTVSHLRFGPGEVRSPYLCMMADFVACHNFSFLEKYDMLARAKPGAVFLLASPYGPDEVWQHIPDEVAQQIIDRKLKFYVIDATRLAHELGLGARINTIMQTCFFAISEVLPQAEAIEALKQAIKKTYGRKGEEIVRKNWQAVDAAVGALKPVKVPARPAGKVKLPPVVAGDAPEFVRKVTATIMAQKGDSVPVSAMPEDGTWPTATTQYEKRNIGVEIPVWDPSCCVQCAQCSLVCPHATIRVKAYDGAVLAKAPPAFKSTDAKGKEFAGLKFTVQVAPEDCTGCGLCVQRCPGANKAQPGRKAINMAPQIPLREAEAQNYDFFLNVIPETDTSKLDIGTVKGSQLRRPLFEYSGACAGCGETQYIKLLTQLFGDRLLLANATGCTSIYGGNLPTTPYCQRADGRGPVWSNSLFEDNAEFGMGMRLTCDKLGAFALELVDKLLAAGKGCPPKELLEAVKAADQKTPEGVEAQRGRVAEMKKALASCDCAECRSLLPIADFLVRKSVWVLGGDGWAYDIGYGGLDHVLASGRNVKMLVLDTEVYSNTGGQASKSTPLGAVAKFAAGGKPQLKKDLGAISMTYGNIYVAQVALGANPAATVRAFVEAEQYDGPAIVIAYSHCIAFGLDDMIMGLEAQKNAVNSGHFPLYRYNPDLLAQGQNPLKLDSKAPSVPFKDVALTENRFKLLQKVNPAHADEMFAKAETNFRRRYKMLEALAALPPA